MPSVQLQPRDHRILEHVRRYRITTPEVLHRLFFPDAEMDAVRSVLKRLDGEFLQSAPLFRRRVYYHLTGRAARAFGEPEEVAAPLGPQAKPTVYGVLVFCCLGRIPRQRFTRDEFAEAFPDLAALPLKSNHYYLDEHEGTPRLGRVAVDLGADHLSLLRRLRARLRRDLQVPAFRALVEEDGFAVALVTAEESKRTALYDALQRRPLGVWVRVEVHPELLDLLEVPNGSR